MDLSSLSASKRNSSCEGLMLNSGKAILTLLYCLSRAILQGTALKSDFVSATAPSKTRTSSSDTSSCCPGPTQLIILRPLLRPELAHNAQRVRSRLRATKKAESQIRKRGAFDTRARGIGEAERSSSFWSPSGGWSRPSTAHTSQIVIYAGKFSSLCKRSSKSARRQDSA